MTEKDVVVIVPAYNEEKHVGSLVKAIRREGYRVLVSDDGSRDRTVEIALDAGAEVLATPLNGGKGSAIRRGLQWFIGSSYEAAVLMDGDGQHAVEDLPVFLQALNTGAHLVVGDRLRDPKGMPALRRATNLVMSGLLGAVSGARVPDSQCGYRALTRVCAQRLKLRTAHFEIESEMILEAARAGLRVASVPIRCLYAGQSSHIRPIRDTRRFVTFLGSYLLRGRS